MIFGGKWSKQDKVVPGCFINFICKNKGKNNKPSSDAILLKDRSGKYLKTADGQYLTVATV